MSGQFEQRRLARPSYQLDVLDAFVGAEQLRAAAGGAGGMAGAHAARRRRDEIARGRVRRDGARRACATSSSAAKGSSAGEEDALRAERERMRHGAELAEGAARRPRRVAPDEGEGAAALAAAAERALAPLDPARPRARGTGRRAARADRATDGGGERPAPVRRLARGGPGRVEAVEERLDLIAELRRRFAAQTLDELLERRAQAVAELDALDGQRSACPRRGAS